VLEDSTTPALRPFSPDPTVLSRIRAIEHRDCIRLAELHSDAMGDSLWAQLGQRFLVELYRGLIDSPYFLGFVYEERDAQGEQQILGFIAGSTDTDRMFQTLFKRRFGVFALAAGPGLIKKPQLISRLLQTKNYTAISRGGDDAIPGESLFCSFTPQCRGKRISAHINKVLFDDLLARGHAFVKITTEVDNEGANRQLRSWGFADRGRFEFYGKEMIRYVLDLNACERVEPCSRHRAV
jgi:ribosomal protein S18 acetylase RimI-like enzyme